MSRRFEKQYSGQGVLDDRALGITLDWGPSVPGNGTPGYSEGAIWIKAGGTIGQQFYINEGSLASSLFHAISLGGISLAGLLATAAELNTIASGVLATAAEVNRNNKTSTREIAAGGATLTVTQVLHDGKTILLDQATGTAVTLPAMTGSGSRFRFVCTVATSGGSQVITATGAHLFGGMFLNTDTTVSTLFTAVAAANPSGSTTITLNGSTTGGRKGDWFEIEDVATSIGIVRGSLNGSGTEATPFS